MKTGRMDSRTGALDLIEEAVYLVRRLPAAVLVLYYAGAVPFVLIFLYFWADMSQGPLTNARIAEAALGVAGGYLWMKFWQTFYACRVREWLTGSERSKWTPGRIWRVLAGQAFIQSWGILVKCLALVIPFFFAPVYAFFSIATVDGARYGGVRKLMSRAFSHARSGGREVYVQVLLLLVFGVFIFLNIITLILFLPYLLQVLFAIDTEFMRAGWSAGNSTFFAAAAGLTYLALDPLLKGTFILRSYYRDARNTGEDLKVDLKRETGRKSASAPLATLLLFACLLGGVLSPATAQAAGSRETEATEEGISGEELDSRIERVLTKREYDWRLPRPGAEEEEEGVLRTFVEAVGRWVHELWVTVGTAVGAALTWLGEKFFGGGRDPVDQRAPVDWAQGLRVFVFIAALVTLGLILLLAWQTWRRRRQITLRATAEPLRARPDLKDEDVTADALPVDEWSRMAAEFKAKGEIRLALRAYYMASLAALAERQLVVLAKAKSNREYRQELARRAHDQTGRIEAFDHNCRVYEEAWYGMHSVNEDILSNFEANQERIRGS